MLRAACPAAAPGTAAGQDWLQAFARNLQDQLQAAAHAQLHPQAPAPDTDSTDERVKDLILQNEQSQSLVEKYKRIIDDTVSFLFLLFIYTQPIVVFSSA